MQHHGHDAVADTGHFSTDVAGLPEAIAPETVELADGEELALRIAPVAKRLGDATVRMLAYNGSIPGPTLRVAEGSEVAVHVTNESELPQTVHWHGLRLGNEYDGTHETQAPIPVGGTFVYRLSFPDPGLYWYHPHIREDYGQEMGLYANIVVVPAAPDYWPPVHREVALTLDDVLVEDGRIAPFSRTETTYVAMGRYGNVFLVAGETELALTARRGEVVRLLLTNTANTRVFDVALPGARMKLVGGDSGRYEREELVESVLLAPSERAVVDVLFPHSGQLALEHRTPATRYVLGAVEVDDAEVEPPLADRFHDLRRNPEWAAERERLAAYVDAPPDKTLGLVAEMDVEVPEGPVVYTCPMHPDVVADVPGRCPECGMKLLATAAGGDGHGAPAHEHAHADEHEHDHGGEHGDHAERHAGHDAHGADGQHGHHHHHGHAESGGIEWEDEMVDVNRGTTSENMRWLVVDRDTGDVGHEIDWRFRVGDLVKLRLVNEMDSDHPMHHPFHIHGAGRFVVLARDGAPEQNLVWKDTVLVRTGETVDLLLDITNAGVWMAHCHIAEHHESGMMFSFVVTEDGG